MSGGRGSSAGFWQRVRLALSAPPPAVYRLPALSEDTRVLLESARVLAEQTPHRVVTEWHLLAATLDHADARTALNAFGSHARVRARTDVELLLAMGPHPGHATFPAERPVLLRAMTHAMSGHRTELTPAHILSALAMGSERVAPALVTLDVDVARVALFPRHGTEGPRSDADLKPGEPAVLILHNDDLTTMECVVHVLVEVLHMSQRDAVERMLNVHRLGSATVAETETEEAELLADAVEQTARILGYPLLCTVHHPSREFSAHRHVEDRRRGRPQPRLNAPDEDDE